MLSVMEFLKLGLETRQKRRAARCTKAPAMCRVQGRARPQGPIVRSLTLHFCQRLFLRLEPMTSWSHGSNFTNYSKAPLSLKD
ncbi:hypothetical protein H5410_002493 [Solanum commersonii]|uniref:Uncharacterized protein n=1 Tax=Solanum commersonii TaxID=4109 RepID=A0A9J6B288_SOLCO|nr:hypothetical protein H5410_002493 [Solanum commersonii]